MSSALLPLRQSWCGVHFSQIWKGKEQASYIGSDVCTRNLLLQAIKFQVISNFHDELESMLNDGDYKILRCIIFSYSVLFQSNINNECTLDYRSEDNKIIHHYSPISPDMMRSVCSKLIATLKNGDYEVRDDIGRIRKLQITHSHRTRRISKDELVDLIKGYVKAYNEQPTIRQLKDYYEQNVDLYSLPLDEIAAKRVSCDLLRKKDDDMEIPACKGLLCVDDKNVDAGVYTEENDIIPAVYVGRECYNVSLIYDDDFVESAIRYLIEIDGYTVIGYKDWFVAGCRLSALPYAVGANLFQLLSERSPSYVGPNDVKQQFDKCVKYANNTKECLLKYFGLLKQRHGQSWVSLIKGYNK